MTSTSVLQHKYVFGLHTGVAQNAAFVDATTVAYVAGYQVVLADTEDRSQKFINSFVGGAGGVELEGFTCLTASPDGKLLAVAERGEKPEINIFDAKTRRKKKNLVHVDACAKCSIISMAFTQSGENLVILTGRPDCSLVVFRWQKGKAEYCASLAAADASLSNPALGSSVAPTTYDLFHTLALNPLDAETCCVLGPHGLRFYRLTDDQALLVRGVTDQLTNRPQSAANVLAAASSMVSGGGGGMFTASGRVEVTCAAWLREPADTALVGASDGRLALYTAGVFQCFLPPCMANGVAVTSLVSLACGVVVGGSDGGLRFLKLALPELGESPEASASMLELTHEWHHNGLHPGMHSLLHPPPMSGSMSLSSSSSSASHGGGGSKSPGGEAGAGVGVRASLGGDGMRDETTPMLSESVVHVSAAMDEDALVVTYADGQLRWCKVSGTPASCRNDGLNPVATVAHRTPLALTGLDVCVRKPFFATCALDRTVRVWDYESGNCELVSQTLDDPLCVAFHPSGLHLAVGFADKLRLHHVLMDGLKVFKTHALKGCREAKFASGGHYLAAAGQNNVVTVFNFYTHEKVAELRGHSGRVRCLSWGPNDATLVSAGSDGALFCWDWEAQKRIGESVTKGVSYASCFMAQASASVAAVAQAAESGEVLDVDVANKHAANMGIYVLSSDKQLRECDIPELQVVASEPTQVPLSSMCLTTAQHLVVCGSGGDAVALANANAAAAAAAAAASSSGRGGSKSSSFNQTTPRSLGASGGGGGGGATAAGGAAGGAGALVGGKPGTLRAYPFPPKADYVEFSCLAGPVVKLCLTQDDRHAIAADASGTVVVLEIKAEKKKGSSSGKGQAPGGMAWSTEVLVTASDLAEKNAIAVDLAAKVDEMQLQNEYQLRLRDMSQSEKAKEIQEKFTQDVDQERNKIELLKEEKADMAAEYEEQLRALDDNHLNALEDEETAYQEAIMNEVEAYQKLLNDRNAQAEAWSAQRTNLVLMAERHLAEVREEGEAQADEDAAFKAQLAAEKAAAQREFQEMETQLDDDVDTEIENIRDRYDSQLSGERELTLRFKGENGILKKKFAGLTKQVDDQKEELKLCVEREAAARAFIRTREDEVKSKKKEIRAWDRTVGEREKHIYELKKKNQELEKFKFVLDFKIKELKTQIEPREAEIGHMKAQIKAMDRELEKYHTSNALMDGLIGDLRKKLDGMQARVSSQRSNLKQSRAHVHALKADLYGCVQQIQEPKLLEAAVKQLAEKHAAAARDQAAADAAAASNNNNSSSTAIVATGDGNNNNSSSSSSSSAAAGAADDAALAGKELDAAVSAEYAAQRAYLERTFATLKEKFAQDCGQAQRQNADAMRVNMALIRDINAAREHNRQTKAAIASRLAQMQRKRIMAKQGKSFFGGGGSSSSSSQSRASSFGGVANGGGTWADGGAGVSSGGDGGEEDAVAAEMFANRERIAQLRELVALLEAQVNGPQGPEDGARNGSSSSNSNNLLPQQPPRPPSAGAKLAPLGALDAPAS